MDHHNADTLTPAVKDTLLALLRSSLWGQERFPFRPPQDTNWQAVYTELRHHTVQHLGVDLLAATDSGNAMTYIKKLANNVRNWQRIMKSQQCLVETLADAGIPCAVLKGASAAVYYPKPDYRCMGDIDLMILPEDLDRTLALLPADWQMHSRNRRHIEFQNNGITLEVHPCFASFQDPKLCGYLDALIYEGVRQAQTVSIDQYNFPCLPRRINGLILLTHINQHMEQGLGLRQIIDWMLFADRELDDQFWKTEFAADTRFLGLENLAIAITRMCQIYLGLRQDILWCQDADEALCEELMEHILCQGNFGRRTPKQFNTAVGVISAARSLPRLLKVLQRIGMQRWHAAQRHRILRPFAWLYQLLQFTAKAFKNEKPFLFLMQVIKAEKTQGPLLDRLGVSRMSNDH